jgi:eukaryotic-like serine/threonine-protein kinase
MKFLLKNIALVLITSFLLVMGLQWYLKVYTLHGQKIKLPDFIDLSLEEAMAASETFTLIPNDSIFIVGREGGIIIDQKPNAGAIVKEGRKIYVTLTKFTADKISVDRLPEMYGKDFERKKKELEIGFELKSEVIDYKFDPGPPNYILAVIYQGDTLISSKGRKTGIEVPKGAKLQFVLSKDSGGKLNLPNLVCLSETEALFILSYLNLSAEKQDVEQITKGTPFVIRQEPAYDPNAVVLMGDTIKIWLSEQKPLDCLTQDELENE